ncbi:hypothetical protein PVAP13_8KG135301 [Panicum virgatum]|uniref:Uncharacterized protein n=1 Tax=Panicum virgatum TaxID=38727 RepID=A0A8T0PFX9_PANVG|nr:hypothetical protein PVAP13_8KG135301 [Panicum virgatum]
MCSVVCRYPQLSCVGNSFLLKTDKLKRRHPDCHVSVGSFIKCLVDDHKSQGAFKKLCMLSSIRGRHWMLNNNNNNTRLSLGLPHLQFCNIISVHIGHICSYTNKTPKNITMIILLISSRNR